jgi:hypothetical protein
MHFDIPHAIYFRLAELAKRRQIPLKEIIYKALVEEANFWDEESQWFLARSGPRGGLAITKERR